jgi:agmatinase
MYAEGRRCIGSGTLPETRIPGRRPHTLETSCDMSSDDEMNEIEFSGERNFLRLPGAYGSRETSYFHIVPVPYDGTASYVPGSRLGPKAIIDASANVEIYDHDLDMEPARVGVFTYPELRIFANNPEDMLAEIERSVSGILSKGRFPVVLGGEHTVGLGALRAFGSRKDFALVCLDAHGDLRDSYQGSRYSHACYLRRASEQVECCSLGVRSISREEMRYAREIGLKVVFAEKLLAEGIDCIDIDFIPENIYLSIDVDVLDPSIMPATGAPEPGGLDWYQAVHLLERIISGRRILGVDFVELCPQPGNPAPDFIAAKLLYKVMGYIAKVSKNRGEDLTGHGKEKTQEEAAGRKNQAAGEGSRH